jgi:hypothetical protein
MFIEVSKKCLVKKIYQKLYMILRKKYTEIQEEVVGTVAV